MSTHGAILYGFYETPPLDVEVTWSETHDAFVQSRHHEVKFLNSCKSRIVNSHFNNAVLRVLLQLVFFAPMFFSPSTIYSSLKILKVFSNIFLHEDGT